MAWTPLLFVIVAALIVIALTTYVQILFGFNSVPAEIYSVDFAQIANKPYTMTEVLSHTKLGDRPVLEQAIESIVTNSLERSQAESLPGSIDTFMKANDMKFYRVKILRRINGADTELLSIQKIETPCGQDNEGWCVNRLDGCDAGRIKIDGNGECGITEICCKASREEYTGYALQDCNDGKGLCSEGHKEITNIGYLFPIPIQMGPFCSNGQIDYSYQPECKDINNGNTPICCGERTNELEIDAGLATKATVPLLYKGDVLGYMEVTAK